MSKHRPIIVIRKKAGHAGHHGGAWKVAYADFVTAMMSLFIVLWLMNTTPQVKQAVAGYFRNPLSNSAETGTDRNGATDNLSWKKRDIRNLKKKIEQAMQARTTLKPLKNQVQVTVTPEGLRIELMEARHGTFFQNGSAELSPSGRDMLTLLAKQLGQVPNRISIEGYTDAKPYPSNTGYTNWDLSTDRANAARRLMQASGLHEGQVSEVRGYGDNDLRLPEKPFDPSNRRVSIVVHYLTMKPGANAMAKTPSGKTAMQPVAAGAGQSEGRPPGGYKKTK
jgi:chemotaxis protein MotB